MNKEIKFNNEEYYFIITEKDYNNLSLNLIDISIFEIGDQSDYYKLLESTIKNQKNNEKITINQFRLWI